MLRSKELTFRPGTYRITFKIKGETQGKNIKGRIARIDIISHEPEKVIVMKNIYTNDLKSPGNYEKISLNFSFKLARKFKFRVFSDGVINIWIDKIEIKRI